MFLGYFRPFELHHLNSPSFDHFIEYTLSFVSILCHLNTPVIGLPLDDENASFCCDGHSLSRSFVFNYML